MPVTLLLADGYPGNSGQEEPCGVELSDMRIVILGAPGTGRNTQAKRLAEKHGITHISTSDLLGQAVKSDNRLGRQAKSAMDSGHLLADELMPDLILERLAEADTTDGFVLVGYPRTLEQAQSLEQALAGMGKTLHMGVLMEMDQDALIQRLAGRWICGSCGQTFNIYTKPSKMDEQCDECGGDLHHRADDNEETIINRIRVFESQTRPVADYYKQKGHLRVVQGLGDLAIIVRAMAKIVDEIDLDRPMPVVLEELPANGHLSVEELEKRIMEKAMQAKMPGVSLAVDDDPGPFTESMYNDNKEGKSDALIDSDAGQTGSGKESEPDISLEPSQASKKSVTKKKKPGSPGKATVTKKVATKKSAQNKKAVTRKAPTAKKKTVAKKKVVAKKKKAVVKEAATKKKTAIKNKKRPVKKKVAVKKPQPKKKVTSNRKPAQKKKAATKKDPAGKKKTVTKKKKPSVKKKAPARKKSKAGSGKSASKKSRKR